MLTIFDTGHKWVKEMAAAADRAKLFGGPDFRVTNDPLAVEGLLFFPMNQFSPKIDKDREVLPYVLGECNATIQDRAQLACYEDKIYQHHLYKDWMPRTQIFYELGEALAFARSYSFNLPLVSKSAIGSSSHNIRLLRTREEAIAEAEMMFDTGITVQGGEQFGYVLWQEYVRHDVTWRVTVLGRQRSFYRRFNYADRPMAAPASEVGFDPIRSWSDVPTSLLEYANSFFNEHGLKFCAVDILPYFEFHMLNDTWRVIETATSWARSFKPHLVPWLGTRYSFASQFDLLMEEIRGGVWD